MPDRIQRIADLMLKDLNGSLGDSDRQELNEWLALSLENRKWYKQVMKSKFYVPRLLKEYAEADVVREDLWIKMAHTPVRTPARIYSISRRMAVAAVVITLFCASAIYWAFLHRGKNIPNIEIARHYNNDVPAPVGNKSCLKLANGAIIFLDSLRNGMLAKQGNANVIKMNAGLLSYNTLPERPTEVFFNTITTQRGGLYQVILPDGTKVWLNSASSLTFPTSFAGIERSVTLTGEAYFEVSHLDVAQPSSGREVPGTKMAGNVPFLVTANGVQVQVMGTHFNVNAYTEETLLRTTLLEGSVKVTKETTSVILKPGQQARVTGDPSSRLVTQSHPEITVVKDVDTEQAIAWKDGMFQFSIDDVGAVMRQLARWYDVDVVYAGSRPNIQLSGSVSKNASLSSVLKVLEISGVHCKIEGRKVTVMP